MDHSTITADVAHILTSVLFVCALSIIAGTILPNLGKIIDALRG